MIKTEIQALKNLMTLNEDELKSCLSITLKSYYRKVITKDKYIIAVGNSPVCLLAHMDTVFSMPPAEFFYDNEKNVLWSPGGMGADDRAGIYAILEVLRKGFKPSIIFTTGEEMGCIGASALLERYNNKDLILPTVKFLIQLDRRGEKDCVFYHCDNKEFAEWIESYDFEFNTGTFTDITVLAPTWKIAAVNLSVGYYNEHTPMEYLNITQLNDTIDKVINILADSDKGRYPTNTKYIPEKIEYHCPICMKSAEHLVNISKYNLGISSVCMDCYDEFIRF